MVGVRMGEDHQIQRAIPKRHLFSQAGQKGRRIGTAIHEHLLARGALDENRVPLAHVEKDNVQLAIGLAGGRDPDQDQNDDQTTHQCLGRQTVRQFVPPSLALFLVLIHDPPPHQKQTITSPHRPSTHPSQADGSIRYNSG